MTLTLLKKKVENNFENKTTFCSQKFFLRSKNIPVRKNHAKKIIFEAKTSSDPRVQNIVCFFPGIQI